jgi:hypothetical protein
VLVDFLRANTDIFAWSPSDMPCIPREVTEHSLDILPHSRAVQQRRAIGAELRKLLKAGFIKEVFHPTWLANPVLVKKKNGKWRMCIDYTSLIKHVLKFLFLCHALIKLLIQQLGVSCFASLMPTPGITKSRRSGCSVTSQCRSASETRVRRINAACNTFSEITSGERLRRT